MLNAASVSVGGLTPRVDACELCATNPETLRASVRIWHSRGAAIQLAVCDRCTAAVRRLIALAGTAGRGGPAQFVVTESSTPVKDVASVVVGLVGEASIIHAFSEPFRAEDGKVYKVRIWGQGRSDGTWIGWLDFVAPGGRVVRRTRRETSQSSRQQLFYWATGVEQSYLEGAFARAT